MLYYQKSNLYQKYFIFCKLIKYEILHCIGLDLLHAIITSGGSYRLRVDLEDWGRNTGYATYRLMF